MCIFKRRAGSFSQVFGQFPNAKYKFRSYDNIAAVPWAESGEEATWEFVS